VADTPTFKEHLDALAAFPAALRQQLDGLSDEALRFRPAEGEWSIVEIIGHLIDVDTLQGGRVGQIIARDNPPLQVLDMDEAVRRGDYQSKQASALVNTFAERRAALVEEWRYLREPGLARAGEHPTRGPLSVAEIIATLARHGPSHRDQVAATLAAYERSRR
jgi:uncharacterized damage-inducible protein DinB